MAGTNSLPGYGDANLGTILEALGTTKFSGTSGENWVHVLNGLIIQGGLTPAHAGSEQVINFNVAFTKQVLGIFTSSYGATFSIDYVTAIDLQKFTFGKSTSTSTRAYWLAIGV